MFYNIIIDQHKIKCKQIQYQISSRISHRQISAPHVTRRHDARRTFHVSRVNLNLGLSSISLTHSILFLYENQFAPLKSNFICSLSTKSKRNPSDHHYINIEFEFHCVFFSDMGLTEVGTDLRDKSQIDYIKSLDYLLALDLHFIHSDLINLSNQGPSIWIFTY